MDFSIGNGLMENKKQVGRLRTAHTIMQQSEVSKHDPVCGTYLIKYLKGNSQVRHPSGDSEGFHSWLERNGLAAHSIRPVVIIWEPDWT